MRHRPSCRSRAMRVLRELYPIERALAEHLPHLRGPQRRGLALWVLGAVLAQSACQAAVLAALLPWAPYYCCVTSEANSLISLDNSGQVSWPEKATGSRI